MIRLFHSVAGLVALSALLVLGSGVRVARAATALTVQGVRLERTAGGRRVYLALSGQPDAHAEFQLGAPPRLVIDLAGTVPDRGVPTARFPLGDDVVASVRVSPHEGRLRAVVDLRAPAGDVSVRCEGNSVIAELRTETERAAPALRDVQVETTATGRRVRLEFSRAPDAERHFVLDDPKRFVVDVTGSPDGYDPVRRYAIHDPVVTQVRSGARDGGLRAVVDLGTAVKPTRVSIEGTTVVAELDIDTARASAPGRPGDLIGRRATVTGTWANGRLQARRVRFVDGTTAAADQVTGRVEQVDPVGHRLRIGGVVVEWTDATRFTDVSATGLAVDMVVAVSGRLAGPALLVAETIEPETVENGEIELEGAVADEAHDPDDTVNLRVLGIPVVVGRTVPLREATLTRRLDERRPPNQLTVSVFDRPLTIGGEVEVSNDTIWNPTLVRHTRDWRVEPLGFVDLELTYPLSRSTFFFLEGVALYGAELSRLSDTNRVYALERGESWVYLGDLLGGDFALQIGRQNVRERRAWWWDRDLDAASLYFDRGRVHAEMRVGEELFSHATDASDVDADEKGVLRVLSNVAWGWLPGQRLDFFGLGQWDRSGHPPDGTWVDVDSDDPSDADLVWLGGRTSGRVPTGTVGELDYLLDGAWVGGHETGFNPETPQCHGGRCNVARVETRAVNGAGLDLRTTWAARLPWRPALTLGYAFGTGDGGSGRGTDGAFRQTGLELDRERFRGVARFRTYGELLHPELSNLHIVTGALGFRFLPASSLELLYHYYRQVQPATFLRAADLDGVLTGDSRAIGQELDAVLSLREWEHVDLQFVGALFYSGSAYQHPHTLAEGLFLTFRYNF